MVTKEGMEYKREKISSDSITKVKSLIGVEVELRGLGVYLYFKDEGGLHSLNPQENNGLYYWIFVKNIPEEEFIIPNNIEKRTSFRHGKIRRKVAQRFIEDRIYKLKESGVDVPIVLKSYLDKKFEKTIEESI